MNKIKTVFKSLAHRNRFSKIVFTCGNADEVGTVCFFVMLAIFVSSYFGC